MPPRTCGTGRGLGPGRGYATALATARCVGLEWPRARPRGWGLSVLSSGPGTPPRSPPRLAWGSGSSGETLRGALVAPGAREEPSLNGQALRAPGLAQPHQVTPALGTPRDPCTQDSLDFLAVAGAQGRQQTGVFALPWPARPSPGRAP